MVNSWEEKELMAAILGDKIPHGPFHSQNFLGLQNKSTVLEVRIVVTPEGRVVTGEDMKGLAGITDSMDVNLSELRELVMDREAWRAVIHGVAKSWTRLSD